MEVCEELAFHGIEYILSVSVADGQVLHVDVEKVKALCTSHITPGALPSTTRGRPRHPCAHSRVGVMCRRSMRTMRRRRTCTPRCSDGGRARRRSAPCAEGVHYQLQIVHVDKPPVRL